VRGVRLSKVVSPSLGGTLQGASGATALAFAHPECGEVQRACGRDASHLTTTAYPDGVAGRSCRRQFKYTAVQHLALIAVLHISRRIVYGPHATRRCDHRAIGGCTRALYDLKGPAELWLLRGLLYQHLRAPGASLIISTYVSAILK
jgi:hypothetical protein